MRWDAIDPDLAQAWAAIANAIIAFLTLLAAMAAALYARRAVAESRSNLQSYIDAERAILHAVGGDVGKIDSDGRPSVAIRIKNRGRSIGRVIEMGVNGSQVGEERRWTVIPPDGEVVVAAFAPPEKGQPLQIDCWIKYRSIGPDIHVSHFSVNVKWYEGGSNGFIAIAPHWIVKVTNQNGHPSDT